MTQNETAIVPQTRPTTRLGRDTETRRRILDCAEEMYDERGYEAISIRDIMKAVRVKQPTIYYYFGDKEGIFRAVVERKVNRLYRQMQTASLATDTRNRLIELALVFFNFSGDRTALTRDSIFIYNFNLQNNKPVDKIKSQLQSLNLGVIGTVERILREGVRRGELKEIDAALYGRAFLHLVEGFGNDRAATVIPSLATTIDQREMAEKLVSLFLEGSAAIPLKDFTAI